MQVRVASFDFIVSKARDPKIAIAITDTIVVVEKLIRASVVFVTQKVIVWLREHGTIGLGKGHFFSIRNESEAAHIILDIGEAVDIYAVTGLTLLRTGHHTIRMQ
jgi:hypothetical protein